MTKEGNGRSGEVRRKNFSRVGFTFTRDRYGNITEFTDNNGDAFLLEPGEQVVFTRASDGNSRQVSIRLTSGQEIPFEEWKEDKLPN